MPQLLLFTGAGGVGRTTVAAATAVLLAERGHKALVLSTDRARSLDEALGVPLGGESRRTGPSGRGGSDDAPPWSAGRQPREVAGGLAALHLDPQRRLEAGWATALGYLADPRSGAHGGFPAFAAEELAVLPGAAEVLALLELREHALSGPWDAIVLDCPPAAVAAQLLGLPETLSWYVEQLDPPQRRIARAMRLGTGERGAEPAADRVLAGLARLVDELREARALLADPDRTTVRLVLTPEPAAVAGARRLTTALALYGHRVAEVVANRVIPAPAGAAPDPWRAACAANQRGQLAEVRAGFPDVPLRTAGYRPASPAGPVALLDLARELYGDDDPLAAAAPDPAPAVERDGPEYVLRLPLPFADPADIELARSGDELVVTVAGHRRLLTLPSGLRRCIAVRAAVRDGALHVRFRPNPELWPR